MPKGRSRDPHKEQLWRDHLTRWQASGLSVRAFCARHRLSLPAFYAWRRTLAQRAGTAPVAPQQPAVTFVPLHITPATVSNSPTLEVVLANGRCLRVPTGFDTATLRSLLTLLEDQPC